ncbi:MAG: hypothetical protein BWY61_01905 [Firmicutes bacterium ADurb.Bin354]|nr:MAG: hypothetical protein BWY61_01905 [Firmicutes bacterium ADurb.Bin354]
MYIRTVTHGIVEFFSAFFVITSALMADIFFSVDGVDVAYHADIVFVEKIICKIAGRIGYYLKIGCVHGHCYL